MPVGMSHRVATGPTVLLLLVGCSNPGNLNGGGTGGAGGNTATSCAGDPDRPAMCTTWHCMDVPTEFGTQTRCTAQPPPGVTPPGGTYTCPATGGGLVCPGPGAGGSGPWTCHPDAGGTLTCTRGGGGGAGGSGGCG